MLLGPIVPAVESHYRCADLRIIGAYESPRVDYVRAIMCRVSAPMFALSKKKANSSRQGAI